MERKDFRQKRKNYYNLIMKTSIIVCLCGQAGKSLQQGRTGS